VEAAEDSVPVLAADRVVAMAADRVVDPVEAQVDLVVRAEARAVGVAPV
jgi:hypothetical protein